MNKLVVTIFFSYWQVILLWLKLFEYNIITKIGTIKLATLHAFLLRLKLPFDSELYTALFDEPLFNPGYHSFNTNNIIVWVKLFVKKEYVIITWIKVSRCIFDALIVEKYVKIGKIYYLLPLPFVQNL